MNPTSLLTLMAAALFVLGLATFLTGVIFLLWRSAGQDLQALATQTANLAQKGLAEEMSGLVGNASALLETLHQLTRTTAGIGIFLTFLGLALMLTSVWLALRLTQTSL